MINKLTPIVALLVFLSPFTAQAESDNDYDHAQGMEHQMDEANEAIDTSTDVIDSEMIIDEEVETESTMDDEPEMPGMH